MLNEMLMGLIEQIQAELGPVQSMRPAYAAADGLLAGCWDCDGSCEDSCTGSCDGSCSGGCSDGCVSEGEGYCDWTR